MDHEQQEQGWLTPFGAAGLACAGARVLVPGHLDEELSAVQSSELRAHLLACGECRRVLKQETSMRRWFQEGRPEKVAVPPNFASEVARRAYQDDPGIDFSAEGSLAGSELRTDSSGSASGSALGDPLVGASRDRGFFSAGLPLDGSPRTPKRGALLSFLLASTAVAAVALFTFAVVLQRETLPQGNQLKALDYIPPWERGATQSSHSLGVPKAPNQASALTPSEPRPEAGSASEEVLNGAAGAAPGASNDPERGPEKGPENGIGDGQ